MDDVRDELSELAAEVSYTVLGLSVLALKNLLPLRRAIARDGLTSALAHEAESSAKAFGRFFIDN